MTITAWRFGRLLKAAYWSQPSSRCTHMRPFPPPDQVLARVFLGIYLMAIPEYVRYLLEEVEIQIEEEHTNYGCNYLDCRR